MNCQMVSSKQEGGVMDLTVKDIRNCHLSLIKIEISSRRSQSVPGPSRVANLFYLELKLVCQNFFKDYILICGDGILN